MNATYLHLSDVLASLGFSAFEAERIVENGFNNAVTWGDSDLTLLNVDRALGLILDGMEANRNSAMTTAMIEEFEKLTENIEYINVAG
jgi:hypothetical protein